MIAAPALRIAALSAALAFPLALLTATPAAAATVLVDTQEELLNAFAVVDNSVVLDANITLDPGESLNVALGQSITLDLAGHTLTIATPGANNAAIGVPETSSLTINATRGGTIHATGGVDGAGIGGGSASAGGTITINGGIINATGGTRGAGIGGGAAGAGGTITISGGTIRATGGDLGDRLAGNGGGAGIGGGDGGSVGVLNVNGIPAVGAATQGGGPFNGSSGSPITNVRQSAGVGYFATTSTVDTGGGRIVLIFNYFVTFTPDGGSATASQTIDYGGMVNEPAAPTREGFTFAGWNVEDAPYGFDSPVTGPITLTATWTAALAPVKVDNQADLQGAFAVNGNTVVLGQDITFGAGQSLNVDPRKSITLDLAGHTLTIATPGANNAAIGVPVRSSLTINATRGGTIIATGGDFGAGIGGGYAGSGGTIIINGGSITATGGSLGAGIGGGYVGAGGSIIITGGSITATGGTDGAGIGGGWNGAGGTIIITGGSITATGTDAAGIGGGGFGGIAGVFRVNGFPVGGAAVDGGGLNASPIDDSVRPAGVGYSATTSTVNDGGRIVLRFNYLVTFTANGGSATASQTVDYGGMVNEPAAPTREGWTFAGWNDAEAPYGFEIPVTGLVTLTATWTAAPATTRVRDQEALQNAFAVDNNIVVLTQNITFVAGQSLNVQSGESITLDLNRFTLTIITPADNNAAIGVPANSSLTINATGGGAIDATGGNFGAGIGGGDGGAGGTITITGGAITATGGNGGAGIGGGFFGAGGTITISGGTINATGNLSGAGIGGGLGRAGAGGTITISGGVVNATGGDYGAGIGGGDFGHGGTTTISGGTINATGGITAAGIGGGFLGAGGTTTISGGATTATGGDSDGVFGPGPGIGAAGILTVIGTPVAGAATTGGGPTASTIDNREPPVGVGYSATTTSTVDGGGRIVLLFSYVVTFTPNDGSITANQTIDYGGTVARPAAPTREGFTFAGWNVEGAPYGFNIPVTGPITLTATWTAVPGVPVPGNPVPGNPVPGNPVPGNPVPGNPTPGFGSPMSELATTGADVKLALGIATLFLAGGITLIALRRRASIRST